MEVPIYSRPRSEDLELKYDKWTIRKDPKLTLKKVKFSVDPCAGCGGEIEEREVYEQVINVTGYIKVRCTQEEFNRIKGNSMQQPTSSKILTDRRDNEAGPAEGNSGVDKAASDPEPEVFKRVRKDRGDRKGHRRRKRQAEARSRKIAGVSKQEWDQIKKHIREGVSCVQP